jgi:hypothetical protein
MLPVLLVLSMFIILFFGVLYIANLKPAKR